MGQPEQQDQGPQTCQNQVSGLFAAASDYEGRLMVAAAQEVLGPCVRHLTGRLCSAAKRTPAIVDDVHGLP